MTSPPHNGESDDELEDELDDQLEEETCSFCGRSAFEVERMVVQGGARICNYCIKEFHAKLNPKPDSKTES